MMLSDHPFPVAELSEITSLNALDLTVESLEQRLELSYAWISAQPDDGCCDCGVDGCVGKCDGCGTLCGLNCDCYSDNACQTNVCIGGSCPVEPGET